jgi:hypothetical protein
MDVSAKTIILAQGDSVPLQYLGAAVVLLWPSLPDEARQAVLKQTSAIAGLPPTNALAEQIKLLLKRNGVLI